VLFEVDVSRSMRLRMNPDRLTREARVIDLLEASTATAWDSWPSRGACSVAVTLDHAAFQQTSIPRHGSDPAWRD
jgi:hypothetical protein